jgi:hypothetical protein
MESMSRNRVFEAGLQSHGSLVRRENGKDRDCISAIASLGRKDILL